jgi:hypothetical protein
MLKCNVCGIEIKIKPDKTELDARADHYAIHNPTPAQWTAAHNKLVEGRERGKAKAREAE